MTKEIKTDGTYYNNHKPTDAHKNGIEVIQTRKYPCGTVTEQLQIEILDRVGRVIGYSPLEKEKIIRKPRKNEN